MDSVHVVFSISLKMSVRTEGAWEGCPSHAPPSSAKKGKNCACTLFNFFLIPYYIIPHKWVSDHMKVEEILRSLVHSDPIYTPCKFILRKHFCGTIVYLISVLNYYTRVKLISVIANFHICFLNTCSIFDTHLSLLYY